MSDLSYKSTENFATSKMPQYGLAAGGTSTCKASGCEDGEQPKPTVKQTMKKTLQYHFIERHSGG